MLNELINEDSKNKLNTKPKLKLIDIDDIVANDLNNKNRVIRNIELLKESIKNDGLFKPLEVYENDEDGTYTLIGGERRYTALRSLVDEDEIEPEISCLVYTVKNEVEEIVKLHISNAQEEMSNADKIKTTKDLLYALSKQPDLKPKGLKTRDWVATFLGCKGKTAQKYINAAKGVETKKQKIEEPDYSYATSLLRNKLRTKVKISNGKAVIYFKNVDELNHILDKMGMIEDV